MNLKCWFGKDNVGDEYCEINGGRGCEGGVMGGGDKVKVESRVGNEIGRESSNGRDGDNGIRGKIKSLGEDMVGRDLEK